MKLHRFSGGVHPGDAKAASEKAGTRTSSIPSFVQILLNQHIGAPAVPIVKKGDRVKTGQLIAKAQGFVSANIHSSVTGTVRSIEQVQSPSGFHAPAIVIDSQEQDEYAFSIPSKIIDIQNTSAETLREKIFESGIAGMGGACFPSHVKLSPPQGKIIDTLIINGAECEPYLTCDYRLMLERPEQVIKGIEIFMRILNVKICVVGIEANKKEAAQAMIRCLGHMNNLIKVEMLPVRYPQGGEKQLIEVITGKKVPGGKLPMDVGCVVHNPATCYAAYEAVFLNKPLYERIVTISGPCIASPQNMYARIGTPASHLIQQAGGLKDKTARLIFGGPMMGAAQGNSSTPVTKGTSGLLAFAQMPYDCSSYDPCVRCGRCVEACVMKLQTAQICMASEFKDFDEAGRLNISDCIECGCCAYVCPSRRPLVQFIKIAKTSLQKKKQTA